MKPKHISLLVFLVFTAVYTAAAVASLPGVPFHPDESTFIYLSMDFEQYGRNPMAMAWQPDRQGEMLQIYRTLDAPLGRYLVGLGRAAAGYGSLPVDWNWSLTWDENRAAGALPSDALLFASRLPMALLLPFSLLLIFLIGRRAWNDRVAWISALLLASNTLVLLHGRRAVSEGPIVFTTVLVLWSLVQAEKRPWLSGLCAGLAFCAKHSLGALAPVGLLAAAWQPGKSLKTVLTHLLLFSTLFALVVAALNPFLWAHPIQAVQDALHNRQDLAQRQVADRPQQALNSPALRLAGLIGGLYLTPPLFAETGNYTENTRASELAYLANPLTSLFRSLAAGTLMFLSGLLGYLALTWQAVRQRPLPRREILLLAASLVQALALLVMVQLPFQRYYMPLVPHACLWTAYGLDRLIRLAVQAVRSARATGRA